MSLFVFYQLNCHGGGGRAGEGRPDEETRQIPGCWEECLCERTYGPCLRNRNRGNLHPSSVTTVSLTVKYLVFQCSGATKTCSGVALYLFWLSNKNGKFFFKTCNFSSSPKPVSLKPLLRALHSIACIKLSLPLGRGSGVSIVFTSYSITTPLLSLWSRGWESAQHTTKNLKVQLHSNHMASCFLIQKLFCLQMRKL